MAKRIVPALLVTVLLSMGLLIVVYSQGTGVGAGMAQTAQIRPLLVDIRQQLPVSVTLAVPVGVSETQTVTVPLMLDLNLQLGIADTITTSVAAAPSKPPLVTVQELAEQGELLVDNADIPYELESTDEVEVIQWRTSESSLGIQLVGEFRNATADETLQGVRFVVTFYDDAGNLLDTDSGYQTLNTVPPGKTSPFQVMSTSVALDEVARYLVQVEPGY